MSETIPPAGPANFEDLYAEHAGRVRSLLWLFGVAETEREDVAQEVWIDVHRSLPLFDPSKGTSRVWIAGIARNAARDYKRTRRRRPEFWIHTAQEPIDTRTGETEAVEARRRAALSSYFERAIPNEEQREAFLLHVFQELKIDEVAEVMGPQPCTVRWRIATARRRLKEEMTEEERRTLLTILPVLSVDELIKAVRETKFPEDELARVWERVSERIEAEAGSVHDPLGSPPAAPSLTPAYPFSARRPMTGGSERRPRHRMEALWMSSGGTGKPRTGEAPPFARSDLEMVRRMVRRRCALHDEADDVVQEAAAALACHDRPLDVPPGCTPSEARRFLASGIVRRQLAYHRRSRVARIGEPVRVRDRDDASRILERLHGAAPSPEERILEHRGVVLVRAAVEELRVNAPELYPVMKGELEGMPLSLVAADLGIALGTAYTRARRGRAAVRERLEQWEEEEKRGARCLRLDAAGARGSDGR